MAESNDVITDFELDKRLTEFMDSPAVFHDPKAEDVFKRHVDKFVTHGYGAWFKETKASERSMFLTLANGVGDCWIQWYDDKGMYGCGCRVDGDGCVVYWKDGEDYKAARDRIRRVFVLMEQMIEVSRTRNVLKALGATFVKGD